MNLFVVPLQFKSTLPKCNQVHDTRLQSKAGGVHSWNYAMGHWIVSTLWV